MIGTGTDVVGTANDTRPGSFPPRVVARGQCRPTCNHIGDWCAAGQWRWGVQQKYVIPNQNPIHVATRNRPPNNSGKKLAKTSETDKRLNLLTFFERPRRE